MKSPPDRGGGEYLENPLCTIYRDCTLSYFRDVLFASGEWKKYNPVISFVERKTKGFGHKKADRRTALSGEP